MQTKATRKTYFWLLYNSTYNSTQQNTKRSKQTCKRRLLTCDATVKLRATPPAFKLMRKILQSGSSVNLLMAASRAANVMLPFNCTQDTPDCNQLTMLSSQYIIHVLIKEKVTSKFTLCREQFMRSKNDVNWLKTIPFAEPSLSTINLISSLYNHFNLFRQSRVIRDCK